MGEGVLRDKAGRRVSAAPAPCGHLMLLHHLSHMAPTIAAGSRQWFHTLAPYDQTNNARFNADALGMQVPLAARQEVEPVGTAWPTILCFFLPAIIAYVTAVAICWRQPSLWGLPVTTFANYVLYTVMHEALHR